MLHTSLPGSKEKSETHVVVFGWCGPILSAEFISSVLLKNSLPSGMVALEII